MRQIHALGYQEVTPQDGLGYRHNSGPERADNPYIIVQAFETQHDYANRPALPHTPRLAKARKQGMLDANYGQSISFPSTYKRCFRLEVPVWSDAEKAHSLPETANAPDAPATLAQPVLPAVDKAPQPGEQEPAGAEATAADEKKLSLTFFCTGGDAMCAEIAQVILR